MTDGLPKGFLFAGVHCGIKTDAAKRDLTLIVSKSPAVAAGVFTQNRVCAAPVQVCRRRLPTAQARGIVVNSGNANACTGEQGIRDAERMTALLAERLDCTAEQVFVCSTGVIGRHLPTAKIEAGIDHAFAELGSSTEAFEHASQGILTTDTRTKLASRSVEFFCGRTVHVVGFAKGAAMIGPNLATMLAFVLTDAQLEQDEAHEILKAATDRSFNCIAVEGHTSTNDTVLLLANGASGASLTAVDQKAFADAVAGVCLDLAQMIVDDAEGASHRVRIDVIGLRTDAEARQIAKAVAHSALVKTAIHGNDPNWGRICSAAGYAGIEFAETDMSLRLNSVLLYDRGKPAPIDDAAVSKAMKENRDVHIELSFTLGAGACRFWTSDLTAQYVRLNADYTT